MGGLILCMGRLAKKPYYISTASVNIYSIEELCYYIKQNVYLIDETFVNDSLCEWIVNELGMKELGVKLYNMLKEYQKLSNLIKCILKSSMYCSFEEINEIAALLDELESKNEFYRIKSKADNLIERKKYLSAIYEYYNLLGMHTDETVTDEIYGNVWHNIATAYARLYLFERASIYYNKAFELNKSEVSLREFIFAKRYAKDDSDIDKEEYMDIEEELKQLSSKKEANVVSNDIKRIIELKNSGNFDKYCQEIDKILENWKEEYKKSVS